MLKQIHIKNFRSCKDVTISHIGELIALVGRNAAGKTNVLRAIEWAARMATASSPETLHRFLEFRPDEQVSVSLEVSLKKKTFFYAVSTSFHNVQESPAGYALLLAESVAVQEHGGEKEELLSRTGNEVRGNLFDGPIHIGGLAPCLPSIITLLPASAPAVKALRPLFEFLTKVRYYSLDEPTDPRAHPRSATSFIPADDYEKWLAKYRETGDPGDSVAMRLLHMVLAKQDQLKRLKELLGSTALNLIEDVKVVTFPVHEGQRSSRQKERQLFYHIDFALCEEAGGGKVSFEYPELSLGTRRVLRMLTSLVFDQSAVMLLEHPEDGIHRGLVMSLMDLLRNHAGPSQVFLSSHSTAVFNTFFPGEVRLVTMTKGQTRVNALSAKQKEAATTFISENGGNLADFLETVEG